MIRTLSAALPVALWAALALGAPSFAQDATAPAADATTTPAAETAPAAETTPAAIMDMTEGAQDAPITVVEYGSFTCPHCAAFHAETYPQLKANYIDTGKIKFTFREVYFDKYGLWASMVARCGGPMRYFPIADMIYDQQRTWIGDQQPATIAANLRTLGKTAGLSEEQVNACLSDEATAKALVAWYQSNATTDGIEATPTFIIDGEKFSGETSYEDFAAKIDAHLATQAGQ